MAIVRRFFWLVIAAFTVGSASMALAGMDLATVRPANAAQAATPTVPSLPGHVATAEELAAAQAVWADSAHADTYDGGVGANTTCARCKSPTNWDYEAPSAELALDCASCKRVPGQPRPELEGGIPVSESEWHNVGCEVCHEPSRDSFMTSIAYWNNAEQAYEPVASAQELCARCHEGRHGFEVIEEQVASEVHTDWECTRCHGAHGESATCEDCHDVSTGPAAEDHLQHQNVNCTSCHDSGQLNIVLDTEPTSQFYGTFVPERYAHTLTSWPSHNLQLEVDCRRCHHRPSVSEPPVAVEVGCDSSGCHEEGAVLHWCPLFKRDPAPGVETLP